MDMTNSEITIASIIVIVFILLFIYLAFFHKTSKLKDGSMAEFTVASRQFNFIVVTFTLIGAFLPGSVYIGWFSWGMAEGLIAEYLVIYGSACFFVMYIFSTRIWVWGKKFDLVTQPDLFQLRFQSKPLTVITALVGFIFEAPWVIMEFAALGWVTNAITGGKIPNWVGIIFFAALVVAYVTKGGMKAVASVEVLKGILIIVIVVFGSLILIYRNFGGFGPMFEQLMAVAPQNMTFNTGGAYPYSYWASIILTGTLGCFAWQSVFARIYTASSLKEVKKSASGGAILIALITLTLLILGASSYLVPGVLDLENPDLVFFYLFSSEFGPVMLGVIGILVIATVLGICGVMFSAHGAAISENVIRIIKPTANDEERVKYTRIVIICYGAIVAAMSMMKLPNLALIAITIYEGIIQFVPLIIFGIFWRRANKWSVGIGFAVGVFIAIVIGVFPDSFTWLGGWTGGPVGFVVNIIINVILGFAIKKESHVDKLFDQANNYKEDRFGNEIIKS